MKVNIPKIIMQTWKTENLPDKWKSSQESIKKYMKDWEYVLMTDEMNEKFIKKHFPDFLKYFKNFKFGIQRADAIRYCWLYVNGGLYIDCDFELLAPLDQLFIKDSDLYLGVSSNNKSIITNGFIACKPKQKCWLLMIEQMKKPLPFYYKFLKNVEVMYSTGPMLLNKVIRENNIPFKLLPMNRINPYSMCEKIYDRKDALLKPLEGSSWVDTKGKIIQKCYCYNDYISIIVTLIVLFILFYIVFVKN